MLAYADQMVLWLPHRNPGRVDIKKTGTCVTGSRLFILNADITDPK